MDQKLNRKLHRDLGYLFLGLIISFSFSGILMNHRQVWQADKYSIETKNIKVKLPNKNLINDEFAEKLAKDLGINDEFRRQKIKENTLKISFAKNDIEININTGKGEIIKYAKTPIISQMFKLHKNTSNWWIYYSDLFGISLIIICVTGAIMIPSHKKFSFKNRGWKLCIAGLIVPLLVLLFV